MILDFSDLNEIADLVEVKPFPWMKEKRFTLVTSIDQLREIVTKAIEAGHCALDLETEGLDNRIHKGTTVHKIVGYCLSYDGIEGIYVPVRHTGEGAAANLDPAEVIKEIGRLVENCVTIYHNSAFDHEFLYGEGVVIDDHRMFEDTLILDYLRDSSDKRHGLKHLSGRFLNMEMIELSDLYPEGTKDLNFAELDPTKVQRDGLNGVLLYAGSDAICTYLLFDFYRTHAYKPVGKGPNGETVFGCVPESDPKKTIYGSQPLVYYIEKINIPALRWLERNRPKIDMEYLARVRQDVAELYHDSIRNITEGIRAEGLTTFHYDDVTSTQKLGEALAFLKDKGRIKTELALTAGGQVETSDAVITELTARYSKQLPFLHDITVFRKLQKVESTYLKPLHENTDGYVDPETGNRAPYHVIGDNTIRFSFLPNRVDTGRFAGSKGRPHHGYSGINVQSIPAGYNTGSFSGKKIQRRPAGTGASNAELYPNLVEAIEGRQGFLIRVYDEHFVRDPLTDTEYCVRSSCEGCPFVEHCEHVEVPTNEEGDLERNVSILSLDAAVRPAIKAREGYAIVAIDQSGVELRVAAAISQEPIWINEFYRCSSCDTTFGGPVNITPSNPVGRRQYEIPVIPPSVCTNCGSDKIGDIHTLTSRLVYGDDVVNKADFGQYRQRSKGANFAILYGGGPGAVARSTGVDMAEGRFIRNRVLSGLQRLNAWFDEVRRECKRNKQVHTYTGRYMRLGDIDHSEGWIRSKAERNAINSIIQGTATGDLIKYSMGKIYLYLRDQGLLDECRMFLTLHDELVFEIRKERLDEVLPPIVSIMTELGEKLKWPVPLKCDIDIGEDYSTPYSWTAMHTIHPRTQRALAPVPKFLWNKIEMRPGMWYINDEGEEVVVPGETTVGATGVEEESVSESKEDNALETRGASPAPVEAEKKTEDKVSIKYSKAREIYMEIRKGRSGAARKNSQGPLFVFQLESAPGLGVGKDPHALRTLMRQLYQIFDYFRAEARGSYVLHLVDWQGEVIISQEDRYLIEPDEFLILARFLGIIGREVR